MVEGFTHVIQCALILCYWLGGHGLSIVHLLASVYRESIAYGAFDPLHHALSVFVAGLPLGKFLAITAWFDDDERRVACDSIPMGRE